MQEKVRKGGRAMYEKYVALREKNKVTDHKVAIETGITKSTFPDWKNGRSQPKLDKLKKIADYFEVPIEYFLEDKGEKHEDA